MRLLLVALVALWPTALNAQPTARFGVGLDTQIQRGSLDFTSRHEEMQLDLGWHVSKSTTAGLAARILLRGAEQHIDPPDVNVPAGYSAPYGLYQVTEQLAGVFVEPRVGRFSAMAALGLAHQEISGYYYLAASFGQDLATDETYDRFGVASSLGVEAALWRPSSDDRFAVVVRLEMSAVRFLRGTRESTQYKTTRETSGPSPGDFAVRGALSLGVHWN